MISCSYELEKDEMRFKKLSEYNDEIKKIDKMIDSW